MPLGLLASFSAAAEEPAAPKTVTGAGAHFSWIIFDELKSDLEQRHHVLLRLFGKESMLGAGCNAGIKKAKENRPGNETFGFVCCPLSEEEVRKEGLTVYPLAREPLLILVNAANPVTDLSVEQVRSIYRGDIRNWKEVGGEDRPIVVVLRPHCKQRPGHWKTILPSLKLFRKDRLDVKSEAGVVRGVSDFVEGMGSIGATWIFNKGDKVKIVKVGGRAPTAQNLKQGKYPFFRELSAVTHGETSEALRALIHDAQTSPAFREVAKKYELLPLNEMR